MKFLLTISSLVLVSSMSMAADRNCAMEGWQAASPTDEQNAKAMANMESVKKLFLDSKDKLDADKVALQDSFKTHPIVQSAVEDAIRTLMMDFAPLGKAALTAMIDTINLLSNDQRKAFDTAYEACRKDQGAGSGLPGIDQHALDFALGM